MKRAVCPLCSNEGPIDTHHTQYEPEEITIDICPNCHASIHRGNDYHPELKPAPRSRPRIETVDTLSLRREVEELRGLLDVAEERKTAAEREARIYSMASDGIGEELELLEQKLAAALEAHPDPVYEAIVGAKRRGGAGP